MLHETAQVELGHVLSLLSIQGAARWRVGGGGGTAVYVGLTEDLGKG